RTFVVSWKEAADKKESVERNRTWIGKTGALRCLFFRLVKSTFFVYISRQAQANLIFLMARCLTGSGSDPTDPVRRVQAYMLLNG
ncbi:MAG: hypothetical protein Q4D81_09120, partial [Eubacteriales bacterium]|nr:hypothetical protein [Eubacteriales bacterium]